MNFDDKIKKMLGSSKKKKSTTGFNFNMGMPKMSTKKQSNVSDMFGMKKFNMPKMGMGSSLKMPTFGSKGASPRMQSIWKSMGPVQKSTARRYLKDTDGDRVPDRFDCQPRNPMRQDTVQNGVIYLGTKHSGDQVYIYQISESQAKSGNYYHTSFIPKPSKYYTIVNTLSNNKPFLFVSEDDSLNKALEGVKEILLDYHDEWFDTTAELKERIQTVMFPENTQIAIYKFDGTKLIPIENDTIIGTASIKRTTTGTIRK